MKAVSKQNTHGKSSAPFFGALDGFRGLLALFVAIYHTYWFSHINSSAFFNHGPIIIDLFFVFSGFLLFLLYRDRLKTGADGLNFIKKRFARLYPLHLFVLCLFVAFASARLVFHAFGMAHLEPGEVLPFQNGARESVSTLLSNLTLTHAMGLHDTTSFNVPSWTISVEFFAYFTLTVLLLKTQINKFWHYGLLTVFIASIYVFLSRVKPDMNITFDYAFLRCLGGFYTGVVVAGAYIWLKKSGWPEKISFYQASFIEIIVVLLSTLFIIYCPGKLQFFVAPILFIFVLVFAFDKGIISKVMMSRVFKYLAKISYSVYMVHMLIAVFFYAFAIIIVSRILGPGWFEGSILGDLYLLPYMACVITASHFTQKYVEVPCQKFLMSTKLLPHWVGAKLGLSATTKS